MNPHQDPRHSALVDAERDNKRLDAEALEGTERAKREQAQEERLLTGMELECRQRLRCISKDLAAAVDDPAVSARKTRDWLEDELRQTRAEEILNTAHHFARFAERMRGQMEKMLNALLHATADK